MRREGAVVSKTKVYEDGHGRGTAVFRMVNDVEITLAATRLKLETAGPRIKQEEPIRYADACVNLHCCYDPRLDHFCPAHFLYFKSTTAPPPRGLLFLCCFAFSCILAFLTPLFIHSFDPVIDCWT